MRTKPVAAETADASKMPPSKMARSDWPVSADSRSRTAEIVACRTSRGRLTAFSRFWANSSGSKAPPTLPRGSLPNALLTDQAFTRFGQAPDDT